jgi:hypothetical protein
LLFLLSPLLLPGCSKGIPTSVAVRPTSSFHLYKSLDQGRSWAEVGSGLPQSVRINALAIAGAIAYAGSDAGIFIGSVAKNILTTFYSGNESVLATISCVAREFLQQSRENRFGGSGSALC